MPLDGPDRVMAGVTVVIAVYGSLFGIAELLRRWGVDGERTRSLVHVMGAILALGLPYLFGSPWPVVVMAIVFAASMVVSRRLGLLGSIHDVPRDTVGAAMFPLGIAAADALTGGQGPGYPIAVLALGLGDPAAAIAGRRCAHRYAVIWGTRRSFEGSAVACLVSGATAIVVLQMAGVGLPSLVVTCPCRRRRRGARRGYVTARVRQPRDPLRCGRRGGRRRRALAAGCRRRGARDGHRGGRRPGSVGQDRPDPPVRSSAMSESTVLRLREMSPGELDSSTDRRLAPDHPFLSVGTWRAFVAGDRRDEVRLVASIDPRQRVPAGPVGAIGFIEARGDVRLPAVVGAMRLALAGAESWLLASGASLVRCPVQFSTWYGHRAMTDGFPEQGGPSPFPMEPVNGPGLTEVMTAAGFTVAHTAASYRVPVERWVAGAQLGETLLRSRGFSDRPIRLDRLDEELRTIHAISTAAFRQSWGFSDIAPDEFQAIYRPLVPLIEPALVRVADAPDGTPVGFILAYADPAASPGHPDARFIVKSLAVLPEVRRAVPGIGTGLAVAVHRQAAARGYPVGIHACVADEAYTQRISARFGERFRSYATFEKVLP